MSTEHRQPHELRDADSAAARGAPTPATEDQAAQDADQLREDIEQTREQFGDTVEALAGKANLRAQVTERVAQRKQQLRDLGQQAQTKLGDQQQVKQLASTVQQKAASNPPIVVAAGLVTVAAVVLVRRRRRSRR